MAAEPPTQAAQESRKAIDESLSDRLCTALGDGEPAVVWTDCGEEVVVHAADARVRRDGDALLAEIPLETEQTGRGVLVVPLLEAAGKLVTSGRPWGDERLAQRWGTQVQDVAIATLADALHPADESAR